MRVFKTKYFHLWAKSERISEKQIIDLAEDICKGLFEANLGNGLFKKRIARKGQGKSSGFRAIVAFKKEDKSIFMFGYAKKDLKNISLSELTVYRKLTKYYLDLSESKITELIKNGELFEVSP